VIWLIKVNQSHTTFTLKQGQYIQNMLHQTTSRFLSPILVKYLGLNLDKRLTWTLHHIQTKRLTRLRMLNPFLLKNINTNLITKVLIYKILLKYIWTYGLPLRGSAKKNNTNKNQAFQNVALRWLSNDLPYISNLPLHNDLNMRTADEEAHLYYARFHKQFQTHSNILIKNLSILTLP